MSRRVIRRSALAGILLAGGASGHASAANPSYEFSIPSKATAEALIDFAIQANISMGGASACTGTSVPLAGRFTIDQALARLLSRSTCEFFTSSPGTVRIVPRRIPPSTSPLRQPAIAMPGLRQVRPPQSDVPEVVVTATKRPMAAYRIAAAVSAVRGEDLRRSNITDAGDLAAQLAGIATTNLGPGRDKILIRGLSDGTFTGRTQSTVGIYLDNTPVTYNAPDPDLRLADIEAVEILRGPQGALYGAGNLSGIYRIVPAKPDPEQRSGNLRLGTSVTRSGSPGSEVEGALNLPLASGRAALRAVAYKEIDGGYIDNVESGVSNIDRTVRAGGRVAARAFLGSDWTATLSGVRQSIRSNDTQYVDARYGRLRRANEIREQSKNIFDQVGLAIEGSLPWGDLNVSAALLHHAYANRADASTALPLFGAGSAKVGAYDEDVDNRSLVFDAVLTSRRTGALQWLLGSSGSTANINTRSMVQTRALAASPALTLYDENRSDDRFEIAIYGEATYALTAKLAAVAGARVSYATIDTRSLVLAPQSQQSRWFADNARSTELTPTAAIKYQAAEKTLLYGAASVGRRPAGFNTGGRIEVAFTTPEPGPGPRRRFEADTLVNLEIGLKSTFWSGRGAIRAAGFYELWRDIQTDQFLLSGLSYTANAGEGRNPGLEAELALRPTARLSIQANALVDSPRLVSVAPGFAARRGSPLPGVAKVSGGGRVVYEWPIRGELTGSASYDAEYIGRSNLTFDPAGEAKMGGYIIDKLAVGVRSTHWAFSATLSNPADAAGNTFSYGNPFEFRQTRQVTPQRPRTISAVVTASF